MSQNKIALDAIKNKYFSFTGEVTGIEFTISSIIFAPLSYFLFAGCFAAANQYDSCRKYGFCGESEPMWFLLILICIIGFILSFWCLLSFLIRRFKTLGFSANFAWIMLVPPLNIFALLALIFMKPSNKKEETKE